MSHWVFFYVPLGFFMHLIIFAHKITIVLIVLQSVRTDWAWLLNVAQCTRLARKLHLRQELGEEVTGEGG